MKNIPRYIKPQTKENIELFAKKYIDKNIPYYGIFEDRIFKTKRGWKIFLGKHLNKKDKKILLYIIYSPVYCTICNEKIEIDKFKFEGCYKINASHPKNENFSKYCKKCSDSYAYKKYLKYDKPKLLSKNELEQILIQYKENGNIYYNPFNKKILKCLHSWNSSLNRYALPEDRLSIIYSMQKKVKCVYCKKELDKFHIKNIKKTSSQPAISCHPDNPIFLKHCRECSKNREYNKNLNKKLTNEQKLRIKEAAIKFYKTDAGAEWKLKQSERTKKYFSSKKGKKTILKNSKLASIRMKQMILDGRFVPNITNTFTHWDAKIDINGNIKRFRSSWEACFWFSNQHLSYETVRIPYITEQNEERSYIVDFFDEKTKTIYEIKPIIFYEKQQHKMNEVIKYCFKNNIKFTWINENNIMNYIDTTKFLGCNREQLEKLLKGIKNGKS